MTDIPQAAVDKAAEVVAVHRWETMGVSSVTCECGEILYGDESLTQFAADEAFRAHLARAVLAAVWPDVAAAHPVVGRDTLASALLHVQHPDNPDRPLPMVRAGCAGVLADALLASGVVADAADVRRQTAEDIREVINRQRDPEPDNRADWDDGDWREDTAFQTAEGIAYGVGAGCDCGWPESHLPACKLNKDAAREVGGDRG